MATTMRPRGPLPARVYWIRRGVVLGIPLILIIVLARLLGGSSDAEPSADATATQAGASVETGPIAGPTAQASAGSDGKGAGKGKGKGKKGGKKGGKNATPTETPTPEPVLAEPTGPCLASDIVATPAIASAPGGADIAITINLRTIATPACTWQASAQTMTATITSGDDYIWSSRECPAAIPPQDVVIRQAVDAPVVVTWSARRSDETCSKFADWAKVGFYHVEVAALGGEPTDVQFELTPAVPAVVTQTAEPTDQGGGKQGGGKQGGGDTSHTPGEDGQGNSAG